MNARPQVAMTTALATLVGVAVAACTVGPNYKRPEVSVPDKYGSLPADNTAAPLAQPAMSDADLSRWWTQFHDPELESLVTRALQSNLDLQSAASRIRQAREQEIVAGAAYLPSVSSSAAAVRLHANTNPLAGLAGGAQQAASGGGSGTTLDLYSVGFDATWEADVFGGTTHAVQAAKANAEAAVWQLRDGQVSLSAEVANSYLTLRTTQARLAIVKESAEHQRSLLDLASARARAGFVTQLDVNQQRTQLAATTAQIPTLDAEGHAQVHALSVLLGQEPGATATELAATAAMPAVPGALPVGLPSELLRRRPDIRLAERQLASSTAEVGVAVANLYPKFNLIGALTLASTSTGSLFSGGSLANLGVGMISWPVFEGGKLRANVRANEERRQQAYLAYRKSVLTALQDAEDALTRYESEQRRLVSLQQAEMAAASSQHIAEDQYRNGVVTFINVLTATTTELNARDQVEQSAQSLAQDLVSLYKALGGGWSDQGEKP